MLSEFLVWFPVTYHLNDPILEKITKSPEWNVISKIYFQSLFVRSEYLRYDVRLSVTTITCNISNCYKSTRLFQRAIEQVITSNFRLNQGSLIFLPQVW